MQTFKYFYKILSKSKIVILIYLGIFIAISAVFGIVGKQQNETIFAQQRANIAIIDGDNSELSALLAEQLASRHNIVPVIDNSDETIRDMLYNAEIDYALWIPQGFSSGTAKTLKSSGAAGTYYADYIDSFLSQYVSAVHAYQNSGYSLTEATAKAKANLQKEGDTRLISLDNNKPDFNKALLGSVPSVYYYYLYLAFALLGVLTFALMPTFMAFDRKAIDIRLNYSSQPKINRSLLLFFSSLIFSFALFCALLLYGLIVYKDEIFKNGGLVCILNALCFTIVSLSVTFFGSKLCASNPKVVSAVANTLTQAFCFLGGVFVPLSIMSPQIIEISKFMPTYWYVMVPNTIYGSGEITLNVWQAMGIQLLFAAAFFTTALALSARSRRA